MIRIQAVEAEINQILRTYRLLRSEQAGKLTQDQIVLRDTLIEEKLAERDKLHMAMKLELNQHSHREAV